MEKTIEEVAGHEEREVVTLQVERDDHLVGRIREHLEKLRDAVEEAEAAGLEVRVRFGVNEDKTGIDFGQPLSYRAVRVREGEVDGLDDPDADEPEEVKKSEKEAIPF